MALSQRDEDLKMMLAAHCHLGTKNCDAQMERYIYKRRVNDGIYIINLGKTWDKLQLAARVIVAIENPVDIVVQSARPYAQRAVLKFAFYTGAKALAGRYTPGARPPQGRPRARVLICGGLGVPTCCCATLQRPPPACRGRRWGAARLLGACLRCYVCMSTALQQWRFEPRPRALLGPLALLSYRRCRAALSRIATQSAGLALLPLPRQVLSGHHLDLVVEWQRRKQV